MPIKTVCFDTSFFRSQINKLDEIYPINEYLHTITETTQLELNDTDTSNEREKHIRQKAFFKSLDYNLLNPRGLVLSQEVSAYIHDESVNPLSIILYGKIDNKILLDNKAVEKLKRRVDEMNYWENYYWKCIKITTNPSSDIDVNKISKKLNEIITSNYPILIQNNLDISKLYRANQNDFKTKCPACYLYLVFISFLYLLEKNQSEPAKISLEIDGKIKQMGLQKSYITDIIIASSYLPYLDCFALGDKVQCALLKLIFPEYKDKIKFHSSEEG